MMNDGGLDGASGRRADSAIQAFTLSLATNAPFSGPDKEIVDALKETERTSEGMSAQYRAGLFRRKLNALGFAQ